MCDERVECPCRQKFGDSDCVRVEIGSAAWKRLSRRQVQRIERLHDEFSEIDPLPLQERLSGISTEPDPEDTILKTEVALHVFQLIDITTDLSLELRRLLFHSVALILADYRCDYRKRIARALPGRETVSACDVGPVNRTQPGAMRDALLCLGSVRIADHSKSCRPIGIGRSNLSFAAFLVA